MSKHVYPSALQAKSLSCSSVSVFGVFEHSRLNRLYLVSYSGRGMQILLSNLLLMAGSSSQGKLVAPKTRSLPPLWPTPSICTKNSVLTRLLDQLSPSLRFPVIESTSSMKIMLDFSFLASQNNDLTIFSLSPTYLLMISLLDTLKKVDSDISWAQAFAMKVLPVPGGPQSKIPFQGLRLPLKISGNRRGMMTASLRASLALESPATSSQVTVGFSLTITPSRLFLISAFSSLVQLLRIFFPSLFLMNSLIFLISERKASSCSRNASLVDSCYSLRRSRNLRQTFLVLSFAMVMAGKSPSLLAWLNFMRYSSILSLQTFQVSQILIVYPQIPKAEYQQNDRNHKLSARFIGRELGDPFCCKQGCVSGGRRAVIWADGFKQFVIVVGPS